MIQLRPRSPASRTLALAILGVLIGLVWLAVINPLWMRHHDNGEALANGTRLLAGLRAAIADGGRIKEDDETGQLDRYRSDFLTGVEDPIIVADLQTRLGALTSARNIEVTSARALPPKHRDGLMYLGLRLSIRGEMNSLHQVLHAVETTSPLLFVDRLAMRLDDRGAGGRDRGAESLAPMTADLDIYGAKWPGLGEAPGSTKGR
jgi:general secretion pathway protein M